MEAHLRFSSAYSLFLLGSDPLTRKVFAWFDQWYLQAKNNLDGSLQIYLSINKRKEAAKVLLNLGVIEQRQSNYDQALALFQRSLQGAKATKTLDVEIAAGEGMGVALAAKNDFQSALDALNQSLEIATVTKDSTRQTELLWRSAETYYAMGDYSRAATLAEGAVELARVSRLPKLTYLATTTLELLVNRMRHKRNSSLLLRLCSRQ
jgi:tetratricopeptide (TPR) repeat protein